MFSAKINISGSGVKAVRQFGVTFGLVIFFWGWVLLRHNNVLGYGAFTLGGFFLFLSWLLPHLLLPVQKIFTAFGAAAGFVFTSIVLVIFFYFVLTPIALLGKLFGKKFIQKDFNLKRSTYWDKQEAIDIDKEGYKKQY